jgi:hypothetical protein
VFIFVLKCDKRMNLLCAHGSFFSLTLVSRRFQHLLFVVFVINTNEVEYVIL